MPRTGKELMVLYSGVGPPLMTVGAVASVNFAIYDNVRRALFRKEINKGTVEGEKVRGGQEVGGRARSCSFGMYSSFTFHHVRVLVT